ncbi:hypothetical protein C8Q76DRAFT_813379 [Earliella scabrosa]|nr:hypothetical protein C8Q76DRAFT_813379 [Earliella scabrosa]
MPRANANDGQAVKIPRPRERPTIMRPSQAPTSLAFQMRLSATYDQLKVFCNVVETVAKLADKHVDLCHDHVRSPGWPRFLRIARKECPLVESFTDAWPVNIIVSEHRRLKYQRPSKKPNPHRRKGLAHWTKWATDENLRLLVPGLLHSAPTARPAPAPGANVLQEPSEIPIEFDDESDNEPDSNAGVPLTATPVNLSTLARTIVTELNARSASSRSGGDTVRGSPSPSSSSTGSGTPSSVVPPGRSRCQTPPTQLASSTTVNARTDPVLAFLRGLDPEQTDLLPVFVAMGVTDGAALQGVARMSTRDAWVYSWVKENRITELQFTAIVSGFKKMAYVPPTASQISDGGIRARWS